VKDKRLTSSFFAGDPVNVARNLLGKVIVRCFSDGRIERYQITETEAYRGEDDLACHAAKGRTRRTEVMYHKGGVIYVYLVYGMYWMLNFVTSEEGFPAAVLIRGAGKISGPGRLGRELQLDKSFYGEDLSNSARLWLEDTTNLSVYKSTPRVGIHYAGEWVHRKWRFIKYDGANT
jgi:DNA-3-methyladenine glycosylase